MNVDHYHQNNVNIACYEALLTFFENETINCLLEESECIVYADKNQILAHSFLFWSEELLKKFGDKLRTYRSDNIVTVQSGNTFVILLQDFSPNNSVFIQCIWRNLQTCQEIIYDVPITKLFEYQIHNQLEIVVNAATLDVYCFYRPTSECVVIRYSNQYLREHETEIRSCFRDSLKMHLSRVLVDLCVFYLVPPLAIEPLSMTSMVQMKVGNGIGSTVACAGEGYCFLNA